MAETVGQHGLAAFVNPSNGDALNAEVIKGNDNSVRTAYVGHDDDGGIHVQSSLLAARPAAGTTGRKWLTTDVGAVRLWYDDGSAWQEISYVSSTGTPVLSNLVITSNLTVDTNTLLVDAANNRVGINVTSPTVALDVVGAAKLSSNLTVEAGGITVTGTSSVVGTLSATTFSGSGASLTSLPSSSLTGALPAISGASLTSLTAANLTGTTLPASIVASSLTSVGSLSSLTVAGTTTLQQTLNKVTITAASPSSTTNYDVLTQAIHYYTTNSANAWTLNIRGNSGTTLASTMAVGQSMTILFLATNGVTTTHYPTAYQIDGASITPKWRSGTAVTAATANAIDIYTYTIVRTAGGFTLFASRDFFS